MDKKIRLIIPDMRVLLSLASLDLLDVFSGFSNNIDLVFTDVVLFEATRKSDLLDSQNIRGFVERNSQRIFLAQTCFQDLLAEADKNPTLKLPENLGEVSIYGYLNEIRLLISGSGSSTFVVLDDEWFFDNQYTPSTPSNTHLIPFSMFLRILIGDIDSVEKWLNDFESKTMEQVADEIDSVIESDGFQRECREHMESKEEWLKRFDAMSLDEVMRGLAGYINSDEFQDKCRAHLVSIGAIPKEDK